MVTAIVLVAALALGAGLAVANVAGSRTPGQSASRNIRQSTSDKLADAATLAQQSKVLDALKLYKEVLDQDPGNVEALAESGLLVASVAVQSPSNKGSLLAQAKFFVDQALALAPKDPRVRLYLAIVLREQGDTAGAKSAINDALAENPPPPLRTQIEQIQSTLNG